MEEQVLHLLANAQSSDEGPRKQAEAQLAELNANEAFPISLCSIASHTSVPSNLRQAALLVLKNLVTAGWSESLEEYKGKVLFNDVVKAQLRDAILAIAVSAEDERKVKGNASSVVSKIASADFPDQWPTLVPTLLQTIPSGNPPQVHGALKVLADLVDDGLSEEQFFNVARDLVKVLYDVAVDDGKKSILRALAVSVFRSCFDILETVLEVHKAAVKGFAEETLNAWLPFFIDVVKKPMSQEPTEDDESAFSPIYDEWRGLIAFKLQVIKTLMIIRRVFPGLLSPQTPVLFSATWQELSSVQQPYHHFYVSHDRESRLVDADNLPYSLDFLVLEELDFMQSCLRAPPVRKELEAQVKAQEGGAATDLSSWLSQVLQLAVAFAQMSNEEEGLWDIDVNVFLSEETSVTANYTPRTACGDLVIKLGEWLPVLAVDGLHAYTKHLFESNSSWKLKEAALFILDRLLSDFHDVNRTINSGAAHGLADFVRIAMQSEDTFLYARGIIVAGSVTKTSDFANDPVASAFAEQSLREIKEGSSQVIQAAAIRALQDFLQNLPPAASQPLQIPSISALSHFYGSLDPDELIDGDDLPVTILETLRDTIALNTSICLTEGSSALDLLLTLASKAASNFQITMLANEAFEDIATNVSALGGDAYIRLCEKVMPSLTSAFDVASLTEENALTNLAADLLSIVAEHGSEPLPQGFVSAVMPKLSRVLLASTDGEFIRPATTAAKYMLMHDHKQMFEWHDQQGKSGLEVCLMIIDRSLQPFMDDNAAAEVGGLAAELVEKAGPERLGPYLVQLLQAVANRLVTAEQAAFIQSLILVFARLSLVSAKDVVDFLAQVQLGGSNGLQVVMSKWLENSKYFAGYDEIRQNVIALSKLYNLEDPRLAQTMVKGDLIVSQSDRIMTRSKAKQNPDQYTLIPFPLKVVKVLIEELAGASGAGAQSFPGVHGTGPNTPNPGAADPHVDSGDEEGDSDGSDWEDVGGGAATLDLGAGLTKQQLMAWADNDDGTTPRERMRDDETQAFLVDFFRDVAARGTAGFQGWYDALLVEEKQKLEQGVGS